MTNIYSIGKKDESEDSSHCFFIYHKWVGRKNEREIIHYSNIKILVEGLRVVNEKRNINRELDPYYKTDYVNLILHIPILDKILELICGQNVEEFVFENDQYRIEFYYYNDYLDKPNENGCLNKKGCLGITKFNN